MDKVKIFSESIINKDFNSFMLLKINPDIIKHSDHFLNIASKYGNYKAVQFFLEYKKTKKINIEIIEISALNGHFDIAKLLLKNTNPEAFNNFSIRSASSHGYYQLIKLLLNDKRVDPTALNNNAISIAFDSGHQKVVKLLWNDKRVRNSLKQDNIELYKQLTIQYNIEGFN